MYYVIRPSGLVSAPSLNALNKRYGYKLEEDEFAIVGKDFVVKLTNVDIDFVQDKHKMENLVFAGFFRKDNSAKFMALFNLIFTFIILFKVFSLGG